MKEAKGINIHGNSLRISFQYQGSRVRETLGLEPTKANLKYAINLRAAVMHDIKTGVFDYAKRFPDSKNAAKYGGAVADQSIRVRDLAERYLSIKKTDISFQTVDSYSTYVSVCVKTLGEDRTMSSITGEDILLLRNQLALSRKASTVNVYLTTFKSFLEFSYSSKYTNDELHKFIKPLKESENNPDPFEMDEFEDIINIGCKNDAYKNLITLSVFTGMRTGEVFALAWEDINLEKKIITVRRNITRDRFFKLPKTDAERTINLMPPAVEALKSQRMHTFMAPAITIQVHQKDKTQTKEEIVRPVFRSGYGTKSTNKSTHEWYTTMSFRSNWIKIIRRCGVRYREMYQTRHTYACWLLTAHGNIGYIAKQLGHKDVNMVTKRYGKWMDSQSTDETDHVWSNLKKKGRAPQKTSQK